MDSSPEQNNKTGSETSSQSDAVHLTPVSSKASIGTTSTANDSGINSGRATAGSYASEESAQSTEPSDPPPNIPEPPVVEGGSLHERLRELPQHPDPYSRIGVYAIRAQQVIDQFELRFDPDNSV